MPGSYRFMGHSPILLFKSIRITLHIILTRLEKFLNVFINIVYHIQLEHVMGSTVSYGINEALSKDAFVNQRQPIFWIMGPAKCGKTTLCNFLGVSSKFEVICISKLLRNEAEKNSVFSKDISHSIKRGQYVKNRIVVSLVKNILHSMKDTAKGFILDGFPISLTQAKVFENALGKPDLIIYSTLVMDTLFGRILIVDGEADLEKARQLHIRMTKCCNIIYKYYVNRVHKIVANYPAEETLTKLIVDLEIFWGFRFDQIFSTK